MQHFDATDQASATLELVAAMSHEHGNLLAALKAWIDAPALGVPPVDALANAGKVVEKMLRLQKAEQLCVVGLRQELTERMSLSELLDLTLALAVPRLRARGVSVSLDQPDGIVMVSCNPGRAIVQLFFVLLRLAGKPRDVARTMILSADRLGDAVQLTAFLDAEPKVRETLVIPVAVGG